MSDQGQPPAEKSEEEIWKELQAAEAGQHGAEFADGAKKDKDAPADDGMVPAQEPPPQQTEPDIWANAPADLKQAHDAQVRALESAQTEHARRSIEGRIASYTRRLQERNAAAAQPPPPARQAADPLQELAAEYPEIAKPLQEKLAPITEKLSQFDAQMRSRQEAADQQMDADLQANEAMLERQHPGWSNYLHEYGAVFGEWIVDQPLYYRQAFVTNQNAIVDPYTAIETIAAFKSFVEAHTQPQQGSAPAASNQRLNPRRAAQLAGSASPYAAGSRPVVNGIPESGDDQTLWNAWRDVDPEERKWRNA